ncbi:hypothetical protein CXB51_016135 [Gossypium anomalum]|uniref:Uncharacterized protein n=1 Tax=Gossypium anomalum TaxID=47600 RepID=A0A8J5YVF9_9ROSI|nr:hypothetical protein CXB51_016135 [Gossypium anomalum]
MEKKRATGKETGDESPATKRRREATETVEFNDYDDVLPWLSMEGTCKTDAMSELFKLVDDSTELAPSSTCSPTSYCTKVKFSDNPYSSALIFQSSSSYVTINGNEESCGSSFSDSESSVMASVDMRGIVSTNVKVDNGLEEIRGWLEAEEGSAWSKSEGESRESWMVDWEWDEEQLARFLGEECLF